jgi:methyl-accepting chemotaxis protein
MAFALRKPLVFRTLGDLSISSKVVAAFAVVLALTVGLGAFAVQRLQSVESVSAEIRDNWMPGMAAASRLSAAWKDYRLALARHVVSTNFMDLLGIEKEMTTMRACRRCAPTTNPW